jgi:tetratricopeptide (TPR) repeat protein
LAAEDPAEQSPAGGANPPGRHRRVLRLMALAAVCRGAKRYAEAEAALATAAELADDSPAAAGARSWVYGTSDAARPWLELGELLSDRGRFRDAATKFEAGWKRFPDQPLLLFLCGRALIRAGQPEEGRRRMGLSHWVALGNERVRGKFLEELVRRGEGAAVRRETDVLLRGCWSRDHYFGNVMGQAARAATLNHDWETAERCIQRSLLVLIKNPGLYYVDKASYLTVPHEMLACRARGLLAAGKVDEAMAQARACLAVAPGHVELVCGMVPDLDRLGRTREADELFGRAWSAYQRVLADYPAGPAARSSLATLGSGCRRELDSSLTYAKEAVAADPKSQGFREVLAEVQFRRGDRGAALEVMAGLADEFPRSRLYQRQLKRYRSGDLAGPYPDTEDD